MEKTVKRRVSVERCGELKRTYESKILGLIREYEGRTHARITDIQVTDRYVEESKPTSVKKVSLKVEVI